MKTLKVSEYSSLPFFLCALRDSALHPKMTRYLQRRVAESAEETQNTELFFPAS